MSVKKKNGLNGGAWPMKGMLTLTIGRTTDYEYIQRDLEADMELFDLKEIAYDPYNSSMFIANLEKLGWEKYLVEFSQSWKYISPASKDFESKVLNGLIEIQHNPVVSWMVENAQIKRDANGNIDR
jgi:phage terminase large subunit-like protein